ALKAGSLKFTLRGRKLKGEFALARMAGKGNAWLLIKHRDAYSTELPYRSEDHTPKNSPINMALLKAAEKGGKRPGKKSVSK
ncbi:MAG TPA: hypothetical protein VMV20_07475, partial [Chitinophagaceae bacterium]|nr:hypothetical protein [Chitinophagaceae bacterium]